MRLTVVGCAGSFPLPTSPCSCYLVEHDGFRLLLDLGNGALGALQRHVGLFDVDAIALSHLHADHCLDLCSYVVARRYDPNGTPPPVSLYGPRGTAARIARAYDAPPSDGLADVFTTTDLEPGRREIGPFTVDLERVNHPVETYGIRLTAGGRSLTYSGDTGPTDALVRLAKDTDVLLCEASFLDRADNPPNLHLSGREAGEHAAHAGAGRLLLTHLTAWYDRADSLAEASGAYDGPVEAVDPDACYDL